MFGRGFKLQLAITAACSMAFILFGRARKSGNSNGRFTYAEAGYDQGVFSGIVGNEHFLDVVDHPNDSLLGIIVAVYNLGCFTGCVGAFTFGERLGRRRAMWVAMAWIIVCDKECSMDKRTSTMLMSWFSGRWLASSMRLFESAHDRCPFRDRHRHWSRDLDCPDVSRKLFWIRDNCSQSAGIKLNCPTHTTEAASSAASPCSSESESSRVSGPS